MGIDEKKMSHLRFKITDIVTIKYFLKKVYLILFKVPSFVDNLKEISTKAGLKCETNTFFQENFTETGTNYTLKLLKIYYFIEDFLIKSTDIAFKSFGLKGYIVKLTKVQTNFHYPQTSTERPYLLPPAQITITDRSNIFPVSKSPISETNRKINYPHFFSFKYDINKQAYIGEIIETFDPYYDYNMSNRSKIKLESNKSFRISAKQNDNILITNSDFNESLYDSKLPVSSYSMINDEVSMQLTAKKELQESKLLQKLEMTLKETMGMQGKDDGNNFVEKNKIDYAVGLHVLKLYANRLYDLDDLKKEMDRGSEEDENDANYIEKEGESNQNQAIVELKAEENEEESYEDESSYFDNRKKFKFLLDETNAKSFKPIIMMNILGVLILTALLAMNIIYSTENIHSYLEVNDYYNLLLSSSKRIVSTQLIYSSTFQMMIMSKGYYQHLDSNQSEVFRSEMKEALNMLESCQSYIVLNSKALSNNKFYTDDLVKINFFQILGNGSNIMFNLNDATQLTIAKTLNVLALNLSDINMQNADVFFIIYNLINEYFITLSEFNEEILLYLISLTTKTSDYLIVIFVIAIIIEFLGIFFLGFFFFHLVKYENKILGIFLEIPILKAKTHFLKCEAFLVQMQQGNEDEDVYDEENSVLDTEDKEEMEMKNTSKGTKHKKRKKYKIKYNNLKRFLLKLLVCFSLIEMFFMLDYFMLKTVFDNQLSFIPEINQTFLLNGNMGFLNNAIRLIFLKE